MRSNTGGGDEINSQDVRGVSVSLPVLTKTDKLLEFFGVDLKSTAGAVKAAYRHVQKIRDGKSRDRATEACALVAIGYADAIRAAMEDENLEGVEEMRRQVHEAIMDGDRVVMLLMATISDRDGSIAKTVEEETDGGQQ